MNGYKKIIKSAKTRNMILKMLRFLPDSIMLPLQYRIKLHRKLNLKNPKRFTEKIQWYKIHYKNPLMHICVDKYRVRNYIKTKGLSDILVKCYGRYTLYNSVPWEKLPSSFVAKTTNGSGGLNIIIVKNKTETSASEVFSKLEFNKNEQSASIGGREWAYKGLKNSVIFEELLVNDANPDAGVNDYKIFCYNGRAKYIIVDVDRYIGHKRNFYDRDWNNLHITSDCPAADREIDRPEKLDEMLRIAEKLSEDFPFVRVDLYYVDGKIYFGELTFYPWSGYVQFLPDSFDFEIGRDFIIKDKELI